jgi:hypothetical protein
MKKFILFVIIVFTFLTIAQECLAVELLLDWPSIGGEKLGNQSSVPELISYIYKFALGICGVVALFSIIVGAFQYATSAGDSSKAGDAKDRITQALLGIVILLCAVLILNIVNPDLVNLKLGASTSPSPQMGWACYYCHYPMTYPDPSMYCDKIKFPERFSYKKFCRTDISTASVADSECLKAKSGTEFYFLTKQEPCN